MAFSYTLLLVLILLFPGLCAWAALRFGPPSGLVTPAPDEPNSTATLFIVVLGTVVGHLLGTGFFAVQSGFCHAWPHCWRTASDPNVYKTLLHGKVLGAVSDVDVFAWLFDLTLVSVVTAVLAVFVARIPWVRNRWDAIAFGWLHRAVKAAQQGDAWIIAFVVTKTEHDGATVGYQGIVDQLALGEHQTITMLALSRVDRFLLKITARGATRVDQRHETIAQMQFHRDEIANVAIEVIAKPTARG